MFFARILLSLFCMYYNHCKRTKPWCWPLEGLTQTCFYEFITLIWVASIQFCEIRVYVVVYFNKAFQDYDACTKIMDQLVLIWSGQIIKYVPVLVLIFNKRQNFSGSGDCGIKKSIFNTSLFLTAVYRSEWTERKKRRRTMASDVMCLCVFLLCAGLHFVTGTSEQQYQLI